jgi:hypothetical protein
MRFNHPHTDSPAAPPVHVRFAYLNWQRRRHEYIIKVESVEWTDRYQVLAGTGTGGEFKWVLHGTVVTRDGDPRRELDGHPGNRRRTFLLDTIEHLEVLGEATS